MPGADQSGYAGFTDQVNNHYLSTFGTAALMSLISAGQMVGQMATFGGGGLPTDPTATTSRTSGRWRVRRQARPHRDNSALWVSG